MRTYLAAFFSLLCLQSQAAITQQAVVVDAPVVSVRQGEQDSGNVAIEQLFTNNTFAALTAPAAQNPSITPAPAPVPEPETYALMGIGLMGLLLARRQLAKR